MMILLTSDLHLTDSSRDEYRWTLFHWLKKVMQEYEAEALWILGDLTDAKDYHSSRLVNRVVSSLDYLKLPIFIVRGNHDGLDPDCPYFRFLNALPNVTFYSQPTRDHGFLIVPHSKNEEDFPPPMPSEDLVFMHATFSGAVADNGQTLTGVPASVLDRYKGKKIFSGDVHVPQTLEAKAIPNSCHTERSPELTYVGSPYHVHFGDKFDPRVLLLDTDNGRTRSILVPGPRRRVFDVREGRGIKEHDLKAANKGDQCKVRIHLNRYDVAEAKVWRELVREECEEAGLDLVAIEMVMVQKEERESNDARPVTSLSPKDLLERFARERRIPKDELQNGLRYLK